MFNGSVNIQYTFDAGIDKKVKDGDCSMHIYDVFHKPLAGEPVSNKALRIKNKVTMTAGVLHGKGTRNFSISFGN
jgi:hypothetical protein